ncbi:DUF222 domain-containing protein [Propionibacteriaceae bacterium G1746]|uniref:DUF222 domain-containing protein n=1 Tax=Aestuariimicrobium sp. G57 TaxID=3418485 RepID=UPI003C272C83
MEREDVDESVKRAMVVGLREAHVAQWRAEAESFRLMTEVAGLYFVVPGGGSGSVLAGERLEALGGEGVPLVGEFCVVEVAPVLGLTTDYVRATKASALDLRYRLPRTYELVMAGRLRVWQGRAAASITHQLSRAVCARVDEELSALVGSMPWSRLEKGLRARVMELDPGAAQQGRGAARRGRRVEFGQSGDGITDVVGFLDAGDAVFLNAQLSRIAGILREGGSAESLEVRRAVALGVLASPARALQLLQASLTEELPEGLDPECPARGQRGHVCGQVAVDPDRLLPKVDLVVHLTDATLASGEGWRGV